MISRVMRPTPISSATRKSGCRGLVDERLRFTERGSTSRRGHWSEPCAGGLSTGGVSTEISTLIDLNCQDHVMSGLCPHPLGRAEPSEL